MLNLGDRVLARRKELKLSQEELANRMGLKSRSSISKIEAGREVTQRTVANLAQALEVTVPYLMGWADNPEDQAEYEASILTDDDLMEVIHIYRSLKMDQKAAIKQMAKTYEQLNELSEEGVRD